MRIIDCTTYYSEDLMLDVRFNILNEHVDKFIITESKFSHSGKEKKLNFDVNNFPKFKHKIIFVVAEYDQVINFQKHTGGESLIEQHQRNSLIDGLKDHKHISVKLMPTYGHGAMSDNRHLDETGPVVIKGCAF